MFILTPTGSLNYDGTARFIEHIPSNLRERIKFAVSLDALVSSQTPDELFIMQGIHSEADSTTKRFITEVQKAAALKNVKVTVKDSAFAYSSNTKRFIQFEH